MSDQTPDGIDIRNNPESRAGERDTTTAVARASDGGAPPVDAPRAGEEPETPEGGTASGDPLAGVTISEEDRDEAVSGDTGPDELGGRGPQSGPEGAIPFRGEG